jgi:peptidoglycan/LPS O-acetylase OafA/YrhL
MSQRSVLIDGLKVVASQLIVLHHIVLYSPTAAVLAPAWLATAAFLGGEARYVVQVFLVIGGYLAAQALARPQAPLPRLLWARYLRLAPMLAVALLVVLAASALLPAGRWPDWVTPWPTLGQFIAHLLLLQDVLGMASLSAGAWYVAIDFQLYALLALVAALLQPAGRRPPWQGPLPWAVAALTLASLAWFNRDSALDMWALYFFNAYGLGVLAAWAGRSRTLAALFGLLCALHLADAALATRPRAALAALTALALALWATRESLQGPVQRWLAYWSDAAYGVFLIHYAVIVAATALWLRLDSGSPAAAWGLLFGCWSASLAAGALLQRAVGAPLEHLRPGATRRVNAR